jgi:hypothetical protein
VGYHSRTVKRARTDTRRCARGRLIGGHEHREKDPIPQGRPELRTWTRVLAEVTKAQVLMRASRIVYSTDDTKPIYFDGVVEPAWVDVSEYDRCFSVRLQDRYGRVLHYPD